MKTWSKDERVTDEFKKELGRKGIIDIDGYRYLADEIFGRFAVRRISLAKLKELNVTGQAMISDFDLVDNENSKMFADTDMHRIG